MLCTTTALFFIENKFECAERCISVVKHLPNTWYEATASLPSTKKKNTQQIWMGQLYQVGFFDNVKLKVKGKIKVVFFQIVDILGDDFHLFLPLYFGDWTRQGLMKAGQTFYHWVTSLAFLKILFWGRLVQLPKLVSNFDPPASASHIIWDYNCISPYLTLIFTLEL